MSTLQGFIKHNRVRMSAELADHNPNMADDEWPGTRHWRCVLRVGNKRMTVYFSMGSALEREPTAKDVLDCLAMDASGYENARSFEEWASEYGYDTDSRKAERIFATVGRQAASLKRLLGAEAYERLLWDIERL